MDWKGNAVKAVERLTRQERDSGWMWLCRGQLDSGGILTKTHLKCVGGHMMSSGVKTKEVVVGGNMAD